MKKTMIFTLILMPLIVLGILLLSGNIVNLSTYLYVEYLEFVDDEIVLQKDSDSSVSGEVKVNVFPLLANNKEVEFWSDNDSIVTVDAKGKIVGLDFGETYIHAKSKENGTKTAYCRVRVTSQKIHSLSLSETQKNMYVDDTYILRVNYTPSDAIDVALDYTSSDTSVATVAKNGVVTCVGGGNAIITAYVHSNPNLSVSLLICAKPRVKGMEIERGKSGDEFSSKTSFVFPNIELLPSGASEKISYRVEGTDGAEVASVDENGVITFTKAGTANITAYIDGTDFAVTKKYTSTFNKFSEISFSIDSPTSVDYDDYKNGEELVLKYSFAPLDMDESKLNIVVTDESGAPSEVVKLENGKLLVKRGGKATITISGEGVDDVILAQSTITVSRTADIIGFKGDDFESGATFAYAGKDGIVLDASSLPEDASDEIYYRLSDESLASVKDGKLTFAPSVISSGYGKVTVTAYTQKDVASSVVVVYIDESIEKIDINGDLDSENTVTLNMLKSGEGVRKFALIDDQGGDYSDLKFELGSGVALEQMGDSPIFTLKDKGSATIVVKYEKDGTVVYQKSVTVNVNRLVERIDSLAVKAVWEGLESKNLSIVDSEVYSSASEFEISYALYPSNASATVASLSIVDSSAEGIAVLDGHKVRFSGMGYAKISISVDGVTNIITIRSTFLHPDAQAELNVTGNKIEMSHDNDDTQNLFDYISMLENASKSYISFVVEGNSIDIQNGIISTNHGGTSKIKVYANIGEASPILVGEVSVNVAETAKNTIALGSQYLYTDSKTLDIGSLFTFAPATANEGTKLYYSVSGGATISGSKLTFGTAGKYTVMARLNGQTSGAQITIIYVGSSAVLTQKDIVIIKGTTVMLKPSDEALTSATFDQEFVPSTSDIIVNGAFVTVNGSGKVSFGDEEFNFVCLGKNDISLAPKNVNDYTYIGQKYETGLTAMELSASHLGDGNLTEYINSGYALLTYSASGSASVENNIITFGSAGTYSVTLTLSYKESVVGRYEKSSTISIYTTYGVANITRKSGVELTKAFDEENANNNCIDLTQYLNISPKPFVLNTSVLSVAIVSTTQDIASIDGLNVNFSKGGTFDVKITNTTNPDNTITLSFRINRSASSISLDGTTLDENGENEIVGNRATIYVNPIAMPLDASLNRIITWEITKDEYSVAEKPSTNDRIVFSKANKEIEVTFTLEGGKTFVVKYITTDVMYEVDLDDDTIIVPVGEPFTFISTTGRLEPSKIVFTGTVDGVSRQYDESGEVYYKFTKSFSKLVGIKYDNGTDNYQIERTLISISDKQTISDSEIGILDKTASGEDVEVSTKLEHITASKSVGLKVPELDEYGADGNKLKYALVSSDTSIATISGGVVTFAKAGSVTITASITYKVLPMDNASAVSLEEITFVDKTISYSFVITSTFGSVTNFEGVTLSYEIIYDTMESSVIDLLGGIRRTAPTYGVTEGVPSVTVSGECVEWTGGKLNIVGSGTATIKVTYGTMSKDVAVTVDKYIDTISILETTTQKVITKVVTKSSTYSFNYTLGGTVTPTLVDLVVGLEIDGVAQNSSDYVSYNNGVMTIEGLINGKSYLLTLTAKDGGATKATNYLNIVSVAEEVNIISLSDGSNRNIVISSGEKYIFEDRYNKDIYSISNHNANISVSTIGVFQALKGDEDKITLSASGAQDIEVKYVATENVQKIVLGKSAWEDNHLTAKGSKEDGLGIDLMAVYAPKILPTTARASKTTSDGIASKMFEIKFEIASGWDIAYIENNILYFTAQGTATIRIMSTDEDTKNIYEERKIESTLGYFSSFTASVAFDGETKSSYTFNYSDGSKTPSITYTYLPSDIDLSSDKAKISTSSTDSKVFEWKDGACKFIGGGSASLRFEWNTSSTDTKTQDVQIYVLNKATSVTLTVDGKENNYMVTTYGENESLSLGYSAISSNGANLSPYNITVGSSNTDVAEVEVDGQLVKVHFKGSGQVVITIRVASEKNADGVYDATDTITIVNNANYEVVSLDFEEMTSGEENTNSVTQVLEVGASKNYVIYPTSSECYTSYTFEVADATLASMASLRGARNQYGTQTTRTLRGTQENSILSVNALGEITLKGKGGYVTIKVTALKQNGGNDVFVLNFYVWKKATLSLEEETVVTAKTEWQITPSITNEADGSMVDKTIEYKVTKVTNGEVTVDKNGKVTFASKPSGEGYAEIRVSVMYNGSEEVGKTFKITTTYERARNFKLYKVDGDNKYEVSDGSDVILKTKGKGNATYEVGDVYPSDVNVSLDITKSSSGDAYACATSGNTLTLSGTKATTSEKLKVGVSGSSATITLNITVIQLANSIDITLGDRVVTNNTTSTFAPTIELGYKLDSNEVSDQSATWQIVSGSGATLSVSGKVCALTLTTSEIITLKVTSGDKEVSATASFQMTDITGFSLTTTGYDVISGGTYNDYLYVKPSDTKVILNIVANGNIAGFDGWNYFSGSSSNGSAISFDGNEVTITLGSSPEFSDTITISYRNTAFTNGVTYTQTVSVYRDGIKKLEFKYGDSVMDETLTSGAGLQQMLLFGNQSYYDGVKDYYNMTVSTVDQSEKAFTPSSNAIVWKATKGEAETTLGVNYSGGVAKLITSGLSVSSLEEVYNDNFSSGEITLTAYNLIGIPLSSYTFHFVSGVNVWDEAGYNGTSSALPVVLHNNIVITKATSYASRPDIYGNGKLLDLSARNDTSDPAYGNSEFVSVEINNAINVCINGSTQNNSIVQLTSGVKYAYCEFKYLYRICASNGEHIKRSLFTSFNYAGILSQINKDDASEDPDNGKFYLEDVLMFNIGTRGIEIQGTGAGYVKGFLDVYNYLSEKMAKEAFGELLSKLDPFNLLGKAVMDMAKGYTTTINNQTWVNMVGISTKGSDRKLYYWNSTENDYVDTDAGKHESANGLVRKTDTILGRNVTAWVYSPEHEYLTWDNQYNLDGSLNTDALAKNAKKLERTYGQNA